MARPVEWTRRLPGIRALAPSLPDRVTRIMVQGLFEVSPAQALRIMRQVGGEKYGTSYVVRKACLVAFLERAEQGDDTLRQRRRFERVAAAISKAKDNWVQHHVAIPVSQDAAFKGMDGLPAAVRFRPGQLLVEFTGPEDLLTKLFTLAQAIGNDYERFRSVAADTRRNDS